MNLWWRFSIWLHWSNMWRFMFCCHEFARGPYGHQIGFYDEIVRARHWLRERFVADYTYIIKKWKSWEIEVDKHLQVKVALLFKEFFCVVSCSHIGNTAIIIQVSEHTTRRNLWQELGISLQIPGALLLCNRKFIHVTNDQQNDFLNCSAITKG